MMKKQIILLMTLVVVIVMISTSEGAVVIDGPVAREKLMRDVNNLLDNAKFDELEKLAKELRTTKARFPEGHWKLSYFYEGASTSKYSAKEQWNRWLDLMEKWQRAYPESVTAKVATGSALMRYGWQIRGSGYSNTISEETLKFLADCTSKALAIASKAPKNPADDCPERYHLLLSIGKSSGWDREAFFSTLDKAIKFEPRYYSYYAQATDYLASRWFGQKNEWQSFVETADSLAGRKDDREIYVRMIIGMWKKEWHTFDEPNISWAKAKKGFQDMEHDYPNSPYNLNNFAKFACLAKDKEAARTAFEKIGNAPYFEVWPDNVVDYDKCRFWAGGENVKSRKSRREIYQSNMDQKMIQMDQLAEDGDTFAQYWIGERLLYKTELLQPNYVKAAKLLQLAADKGYAPAEVKLASLYQGGQGVKKDPQAAFLLVQKAALRNDDWAKFVLGGYYQYGTGTEKNLIAACAWYLNSTYSSPNQHKAVLDFVWNKLTEGERAQAEKRALEIRKMLSKVN